MGNIKHFKGFSIQKGDIRVNVSFDRFSKQYEKAQYKLDSAVMNSMIPFMPMQTGTFINLTRAESAALAGTGKVVAAVPPQGRYLYMGKVMVDRKTGKGPRKIPVGPGGYILRFRKGAKLVETERNLKFGNPKATPRWFETAKKKDCKDWVKMVKSTAGGG